MIMRVPKRFETNSSLHWKNRGLYNVSNVQFQDSPQLIDPVNGLEPLYWFEYHEYKRQSNEPMIQMIIQDHVSITISPCVTQGDVIDGH